MIYLSKGGRVPIRTIRVSAPAGAEEGLEMVVFEKIAQKWGVEGGAYP